MTEETRDDMDGLRRLVRTWILEMTTTAGSGHPSSSLSAVELMTGLLFGRGADGRAFFRCDPFVPEHPANDRLIFSKGHATPLYYALWAAAGAIAPDDLATYRQRESVLEGHPTRRFPLTEVPTGSLGQGLSAGLGEALALRDAGSPARVWVLLGDSEIAEGQVWEAAAVAAHYAVGNLVAVVDANRLGQRGATMTGWDIDTIAARFAAFGWRTVTVEEGHDMTQVLAAYATVVNDTTNKPTVVVARTVKGKGVAQMEDAEGWHGRPLPADMLDAALAALGPVDRLLRGTPAVLQDAPVPSDIRHDTVRLPEVSDGTAPRQAYGMALAALAVAHGDVAVLDAETSNSTGADAAKKAASTQFYEMFIAEQNMVGVAVGMARRGRRPFVSTFAAFLTRAADQIRMAQYAGVDIVFAGSHCGVSIGPDGASQMGLEDMALFAALRQSTILYPADGRSAAALTALAYGLSGITYLRTTRAALPSLYASAEAFAVGGSKVLRQSDADTATIVAAGITLHEALAAADTLMAAGTAVRVIDAYSVRPLDAATVAHAARTTGHVVVVEDHHETGGLGTAVRAALDGMPVTLTHLCVRQTPRSATPEELLALEQIDRTAIVAAVRDAAA